jgi:hypothetical protein
MIGTGCGDGIVDQRNVAWVDDYVYTGGASTASGGALAVWDVSNPHAPVLLAEEGTGNRFSEWPGPRNPYLRHVRAFRSRSGVAHPSPVRELAFVPAARLAIEPRG